MAGLQMNLNPMIEYILILEAISGSLYTMIIKFQNSFLMTARADLYKFLLSI